MEDDENNIFSDSPNFYPSQNSEMYNNDEGVGIRDNSQLTRRIFENERTTYSQISHQVR